MYSLDEETRSEYLKAMGITQWISNEELSVIKQLTQVGESVAQSIDVSTSAKPEREQQECLGSARQPIQSATLTYFTYSELSHPCVIIVDRSDEKISEKGLQLCLELERGIKRVFGINCGCGFEQQVHGASHQYQLIETDALIILENSQSSIDESYNYLNTCYRLPLTVHDMLHSPQKKKHLLELLYSQLMN